MSFVSPKVEARRPEPFYGLSLAAGCVDAISFIGFGGVFTANMTGNTVLLGIAIAARFGAIPGSLGIAPPLIAVAAFIGGAIASAPLFPTGFHARRAAAVVLAEAVLVASASVAFGALHGNIVIALCIVLVSLAMGAQSVVAVQTGLPGISTTYVTGTLITAVTRWLSRSRNERGGSIAAHDTWAWFAYLGGAVVGTLFLVALRHAALLPAALLLAALAAWIGRGP